MMARLTSKPGFTAGLLGALLLLQLAVIRLIFSADTEHVYLLGHQLNAVCSFKQLFGLPCPTCGMTRSVVLSLYGEWHQAWQLNPAGLLLTFGIALMSAALLALMSCQWMQRNDVGKAITQWIRCSALFYSTGMGAVLLVNWVIKIAAKLSH